MFFRVLDLFSPSFTGVYFSSSFVLVSSYFVEKSLVELIRKTIFTMSRMPLLVIIITIIIIVDVWLMLEISRTHQFAQRGKYIEDLASKRPHV